MTELRVCTKRGTGFAIVAGLAASVILTTGAYAAGGDDPSTATPIPGVPYIDSGDTTVNTDISDEVCPYTGSTSPDAWYTYTPAVDETLDVSLCNSGYDTKLYIYDSSFGLVACVDDSCPGFMSDILGVTLTGGAQYFIVIDGWGGDRGPYTLEMDIQIPCIVECDPLSTPEGEPPCGDEYVDAYNGGCNSTPEVWSFIECGETVCGKSGTYLFGGLNYRDTDWYLFDIVDDGTDVTWAGVAEFPFLIFILSVPCPAGIVVSGTANPCDLVAISANLNAGQHAVWAGPSIFDSIACESTYEASLTCEIVGPCIVECAPGSTDEGEGPCFDEYVDNYNGGCNSAGEPFQAIDCGETICGLSGTYFFTGLNYRDTDWFLYTAPVAETLTWTLEGDFPILGFIIDLNAGCGGLVILTSATGNPCDIVTMSASVGPGTYSLWAGPSVFSGLTCEQIYNATLDSDQCGGVECPEDTNGDGVVDILDLLKVLAEWGTADADADVNDDGIVDILDLLAVLAAWGPC